MSDIIKPKTSLEGYQNVWLGLTELLRLYVFDISQKAMTATNRQYSAQTVQII